MNAARTWPSPDPWECERHSWESERRRIDDRRVIANNPFTPNLDQGRTDRSRGLTPDQARQSAGQGAARNILGNEVGVPIDRRYPGSIEGKRCAHAGARIEWAEDRAQAVDVDSANSNGLEGASEKTKRFGAVSDQTDASADPIGRIAPRHDEVAKAN